MIAYSIIIAFVGFIVAGLAYNLGHGNSSVTGFIIRGLSPLAILTSLFVLATSVADWAGITGITGSVARCCTSLVPTIAYIIITELREARGQLKNKADTSDNTG